MRFGFYLAALMVVLFAGSTGGVPQAAAQPWRAGPAAGVSASDVGCLAETVYHESRGEPVGGMVAVGQVAMNRVRASASTPCEVVHSRSGGRCQFSWACAATHVLSGDSWDRARTVALALLSSPGLPDMTGGAMFFNVCSHPPGLALSMTARIGAHCFFVRPGSLAARALQPVSFSLDPSTTCAYGWLLSYSARDSFLEKADAPPAVMRRVMHSAPRWRQRR